MNFRTATIRTESEAREFMSASTSGTVTYTDIGGADVSARTAVENWCGDWFCPHLAMWAGADGFETALIAALDAVHSVTIELH